jgi:hypothetical protein
MWMLISFKADLDQFSVRQFGFYLCDCQVIHQPVARFTVKP